MSKAFFIADVHSGNHGGFAGSYQVGLNWRARRILQVVREAAALAGQDRSGLYIAGDLFNSHEPAPQVIAATIAALKDYDWLACDEDADAGPLSRLHHEPGLVGILRGNHDANSTVPGDDALGPLVYIDGFEVIDKVVQYQFADCPHRGPEQWNIDIDGCILGLMVPFQPGKPDEWLPEVLKAHPIVERGIKVLVTHFGIADGNTPGDMADKAIHIDVLRSLCIEHGFRYVFSGDWHTRRKWEFPECTIVQVGALVPTGFNNPGLDGYGSVWSLSPEGLELHELPGPRFVPLATLTQARETLDRWRVERPAVATELFVSLTVPLDQFDEAKELLDAAKAELVIDGYSLELRRDEALQAAGEVRAEAARPQRFDEALRETVQSMTLPPGVSVDAVLDRAEYVMKAAKPKG